MEMNITKIRSFRKSLRMFERLTAQQLKGESCCQGVTLAQCHTILEIEELGQATIVELSTHLGLDKSTLSRTIDGLVNIGLVGRVPQPTDRRFNLLSLTAKGQEVADRINHSNDHFYQQVFQDIGTRGEKTIIDNFEKLVKAINKHQKHIGKVKGCVD
jgi:DNA-binding MarR family transcriptional regulator